MMKMLSLFMLIALCLVSVSLAYEDSYDPTVKNENDIAYSWGGFDFEVYAENLGIFSVSESVNGADSVAVWFDVATGTYDHYEVMIWASIADEDKDGFDLASAKLYFYPAGEYATMTAADTLNWEQMYANGTAFGQVKYTITTVTGTPFQIGAISPGDSYQSPAMFWLDGTASTDSLGYIFEVVTTDSCTVNITGLAIPRE